ncbi:MAG: Mur ligase family protein, partial [Polynucleobacter victoriensis]
PNNGTAVFPADSVYTNYWKKVAGSRTTIDFAFNAPATVNGEWLNASANQLKIITPKGSISVSLLILGEHNARNAVAATAVAIAAGITLATIQSGLEKFEPVSGRMQKHQIDSRTTVIDDSY